MKMRLHRKDRIEAASENFRNYSLRHRFTRREHRVLAHVRHVRSDQLDSGPSRASKCIGGEQNLDNLGIGIVERTDYYRASRRRRTDSNQRFAIRESVNCYGGDAYAHRARKLSRKAPAFRKCEQVDLRRPHSIGPHFRCSTQRGRAEPTRPATSAGRKRGSQAAGSSTSASAIGSRESDASRPPRGVPCRTSVASPSFSSARISM